MPGPANHPGRGLLRGGEHLHDGHYDQLGLGEIQTGGVEEKQMVSSMENILSKDLLCL